MRKTASQIADEVLAKLAGPPTPAQVAAMKTRGAQVNKQRQQGVMNTMRKSTQGATPPAPGAAPVRPMPAGPMR